jgi:hypothetical protein
VRLATSALMSADSDVFSATKLLGRQAANSSSGTPLDTLTNWAPSQLSRLTELWHTAPVGVMRNQAQKSKDIVNESVTQAQQLQAKLKARGTQPTPSAANPKSSAPGNGPAPKATKTAPGSSGSGTKAGPSAKATKTPDAKSSGSAAKNSPSPLLPVPSTTPKPLISAGPNCIVIVGIQVGDCPTTAP